MKNLLTDFFSFTYKLTQASVFAGLFFLLLILSNYLTLPIPRYDFLFIGSILIQIILIWIKWETPREVKVLFLFHILGLILELFKTSPSIGSWSYPEFAYTKILTVPLYAGFMYSAVASFMIQAWRRLDLKLQNYPSYFLSIPLATLIYLNFFTHHFLPDIRWYLITGVAIVFLQTMVYFQPKERIYKMPLILSFFLIGFFVWIAENISTFFGAWTYPEQAQVWQIVSLGKISSWGLLVILSFIIVAHLKHVSVQESVDKK